MVKAADDQVSPALYDVAIIGAGPCGLAVASRLCEATPSALFTDVEHQRFHWIKKHRGRASIIKSEGRRFGVQMQKAPPSSQPTHQYSMLVLDFTSNSWLGRWKSLFSAYGIKHLRSPLFFHPDPRDRDALKEYAFAQSREKELVELTGVVGKETSKHQKKSRAKKSCGYKQLREGTSIDKRDAQDYFTPTNALFCDHCANIISTYTLSGLVHQTKVESIDYHLDGTSHIPATSHFTINTCCGPRYARLVILAIGPGSSSQLPCGLTPSEQRGACHTSLIPNVGCPPPHIQARISAKTPTNIIVVGGGLTSAQVADLCIRRGVTHVWHIMRGPYKVKHFDVDLPWVAKYRNLEMASFWIADTDEERFARIKDARGGGSITPLFKAVEAKHIAAGRLSIFTQTQLVRQSWDERDLKWTVETEPPIESLPRVDYIYYATGAKADIEEVEMLSEMRAKWPIRSIGGLPCLTDDLQWKDNVPLFVTGRFAGLRLGPGAANLEGAKVGAERIGWRVQELLNETRRNGSDVEDTENEVIIDKRTDKENWRDVYDENSRVGNMYGPLGEE